MLRAIKVSVPSGFNPRGRSSFQQLKGNGHQKKKKKKKGNRQGKKGVHPKLKTEKKRTLLLPIFDAVPFVDPWTEISWITPESDFK